MIAERAFLNPELIDSYTLFPSAISSFILVKIITLASTAIPIDSMIPAIPGSVSVISKADNKRTSSMI